MFMLCSFPGPSVLNGFGTNGNTAAYGRFDIYLPGFWVQSLQQASISFILIPFNLCSPFPTCPVHYPNSPLGMCSGVLPKALFSPFSNMSHCPQPSTQNKGNSHKRFFFPTASNSLLTKEIICNNDIIVKNNSSITFKRKEISEGEQVLFCSAVPFPFLVNKAVG